MRGSPGPPAAPERNDGTRKPADAGDDAREHGGEERRQQVAHPSGPIATKLATTIRPLRRSRSPAVARPASSRRSARIKGARGPVGPSAPHRRRHRHGGNRCPASVTSRRGRTGRPRRRSPATRPATGRSSPSAAAHGWSSPRSGSGSWSRRLGKRPSRYASLTTGSSTASRLTRPAG